jgi:hypothetical protein
MRRVRIINDRQYTIERKKRRALVTAELKEEQKGHAEKGRK